MIYVLPERISSKRKSFRCQVHSSKRIISPSIDIFMTVTHVDMKLSCILACCPALCGWGAGVWLDMCFLSLKYGPPPCSPASHSFIPIAALQHLHFGPAPAVL